MHESIFDNNKNAKQSINKKNHQAPVYTVRTDRNHYSAGSFYYSILIGNSIKNNPVDKPMQYKSVNNIKNSFLA